MAGATPALATAEVGSQGARVLAVDRLLGGWRVAWGKVWAQHSVVGMRRAWTPPMDDGGWQEEEGAATSVWE